MGAWRAPGVRARHASKRRHITCGAKGLPGVRVRRLRGVAALRGMRGGHMPLRRPLAGAPAPGGSSCLQVSVGVERSPVPTVGTTGTGHTP
jgi:hypothetical protein